MAKLLYCTTKLVDTEIAQRMNDVAKQNFWNSASLSKEKKKKILFMIQPTPNQKRLSAFVRVRMSLDGSFYWIWLMRHIVMPPTRCTYVRARIRTRYLRLSSIQLYIQSVLYNEARTEVTLFALKTARARRRKFMKLTNYINHVSKA